jgi:hypothetical protein
MNLQTAEKEICSKLNIDYATLNQNDLFTSTQIRGWINLGILESWDYFDWAFTEVRDRSLTTVAGQDEYAYPNDIVSNSVRFLRVYNSDGIYEVYTKVNFEEFLHYLEDNEDGEDKIWSDHNRTLYINHNAFDASMTIEFYAKKRATQVEADSSLLPFSPDSDAYEDSGNHAVVRLAYSYALESEKKKDPNKAQAERTLAYATLQHLADKEQKAQATYQPIDKPLFDNPQIL